MDFKTLSKKFFDEFMKRNPTYASFLGLHEYDGVLPDETREKYVDDINFMKKYLEEFKKSKPEDEKDKIDKEVIIHNLKLWIFVSEKLRFWEHDPNVIDDIGSALFILIVRDFAPIEERIKSVIKALKRMPEVLEQTKGRVKEPYKLWTDVAIESSDMIMDFFDSLLEIQISDEVRKELEHAVEKAKKAVQDFKKYLIEIRSSAKDIYSIGKENFDEMIRLRELGLSTEEILKLGERFLEENKRRLEEIAKRIDPNLTVEEVKKKIRENHPKSFQEVLDKIKEEVKRSRNFIIENNLMYVPKNERVVIEETPKFLRHTTPFAAYFPPAKFDKEQIGIYIITPSVKEKTLEQHNYAAISNTSVHEAYPGHHLQQAVANENPSLIRTLSDATEVVEGWAHYCEEYMKEIGFNKGDEIEFIQTLDMIWRSARIIIDVKLHTGQMSFDEAVNFLIKQTGMHRDHAIAEVRRYTRSPTYQLSYMIGKYLIKKLKEDAKKKLNYSDRDFHTTFLKAGSIPIKYLYKEFGLNMEI